MILGLCTNSATWLYSFFIKSSVMDTWYLVSQVTHLNWPGLKSENFLASCGLQQFEVKSIMNTRELKVMTGHRRIPSKLRPRLFIPCFSRVKDRAKFVRWGGRKTLLFFSLYGLMTWLWSLYKFFKNSKLWGADQKTVHSNQLRHWKNTNVNERLLIDFFNVLTNYL